MRYQSALARRSEISFARQLFSIIFFIRAVEQNFAEPVPESFRCKIALYSSPITNRDRARLLRDNHRDRIRFFRNAETRAMPQTKTAVERFALAHWENTGRRRDPAAAQDHAAIMQRRFRMKQRKQQLRRENRVHDHARVLVNL